MLSPSEFIVGNVRIAKPLSLVFPTETNDETLLVGKVDGAAVAVFLSGRFKSLYFNSGENDNWSGLILPNVRVEVDETSLLDADRFDVSSLAVVRTDTRLAILAKREHSLGSRTLVTLHDNLAPVGAFRATFARWQIVVGEGKNKRVVWSTLDERNSQRRE